MIIPLRVLREYHLLTNHPRLLLTLAMMALWLGGSGSGRAATAPVVPATGRDSCVSIGLAPGSFLSLRSLVTLGLAGVATVWTREAVDPHQGALRSSLERSSFRGLMDFGNTYGNGLIIGGSAVAAAAVGRITDHDRMYRCGLDLGRSFVYSAAITEIIKVSVNRKRPSGGPYSFPSGHTTAAFSAVPVIWYHAGWVAGTGAGAMGVLTGMGRIEKNKHYLSDVIFGAAIGVVTGWAVIDQRRENAWSDHVVATGDRIALRWRF